MTRDRLLGQARADLVALPDLVDQLDPHERNHDVTGYHHKVVGSPALIDLQVVHLLEGGRHRPWKDIDPAVEDPTERFNVERCLELWVKKLTEELPEWPELNEQPSVPGEVSVLLEHWTFITQQDWAPVLGNQIIKLTARIKTKLGIRPEPTYRCPQCGNPAYLQAGGILACTEVQDHDIVVRDYERQMRRRPALSTKDICEEFDLEAGTLRVWKHRRRITPAPHGGWFPWDVFCLLNPDIAEAFETRDTIEPEETQTSA